MEQKIIEVLDQLSAQLGVASEKIWEWALLQVKVDIWTTVIFSIVVLTLISLYPYVFKKVLKKWNNFNYECEFWVTIALAVTGVSLFVLGMVVIDLLYDLPGLIINPEYAAFKNIIDALSNLK